MKNREVCIILTTTNDEAVAYMLAKDLIVKKIAACVQVDKVKSFFFYDNKVQEEDEFRLIIKAASKNYKIIEETIKLNHNYQLPQIIKLDITDGLAQYVDWLNK